MSESPPPPPTPRPKPLTLPTSPPDLPEPQTLLPPSYSTSTQTPNTNPSEPNSIQASDFIPFKPTQFRIPGLNLSKPASSVPAPPDTPLATPKSPTWSGPSSPHTSSPPTISFAKDVTYLRCHYTSRIFSTTRPPSSPLTPPSNQLPHACEDCTQAVATKAEIAIRQRYRKQIEDIETWVKGLIPGKGQKGVGLDMALLKARYQKGKEIRDLKELRDFEINEAWKEYELHFQFRPSRIILDPNDMDSENGSLLVEVLSSDQNSEFSDQCSNPEKDQEVRRLVLESILKESAADKAKREWEENGRAEFERGIEEEIARMKEKVGKAWEKGKVDDNLLDSCQLSENAERIWREKDATGFLRYEKRVGRIRKAGEKNRDDEKPAVIRVREGENGPGEMSSLRSSMNSKDNPEYDQSEMEDVVYGPVGDSSKPPEST